MSDWLSEAEAAEHLNLKVRSIRTLRANGQLRYATFGRSVRIHVSDVRAYLRSSGRSQGKLQPSVTRLRAQADLAAAVEQERNGPTSLYRWRDADGRLLYVGISRKVVRRSTDHALRSEWWWQVASCTVEHFPTRAEAAAAEVAAIRSEGPLYNIVHAVADEGA